MIYSLNSGVQMEMVNDNIVLLRENGDAVTFNDTGSMILEQILKHDESAAEHRLIDMYDTDPVTAHKDIEELISEITKMKLILIANE